ncbi:MAG: hypothetical protein K2Q34_03055 [Alphaproteobacteria bacterium]|nr:hypothetical protein [Alphaproteobacteria bacterium]
MLKFLMMLCVALSSFYVNAAERPGDSVFEMESDHKQGKYDPDTTYPTWYVYDREIDQAIGHRQSDLNNAAAPSKREDFIVIFDRLGKMKAQNSRASDASDVSETSAESEVSLSSTGEPVTSNGYVDALEKGVIPILNSKKAPTAKQRENRQSFVDVLRSYQDEIDPEIFQTAIELIIEPIISGGT